MHLKEVVFAILDRFGIHPHQIYSITIDNGKNMVKMSSLIEKETVPEEEYEGSIECDTAAGEDLEEQDEVLEGMLSDLESVIGHTLVTVRCGAHTAQLVVADACKSHQADLKKVTKVVILYRNAKYKNFFDISGGKYPVTPVPTRWNSYYLMMRTLVNQKDFFMKLGEEFEELSK